HGDTGGVRHPGHLRQRYAERRGRAGALAHTARKYMLATEQGRVSDPRSLRGALLVPCALALAACTAMPGRDQPRPPPIAATHAANPALAATFATAAQAHPGLSGFRLYSLGIDALLLRLELIEQAQRSLDLQYYIFHGDESGRLVTEALL